MSYTEESNKEEYTATAKEPQQTSIASLRYRVMERVRQTDDEEALYNCLTMLEHDNNDIDQFCPYSKVELDQRIAQAEQQISEGRGKPLGTVLQKYKTLYNF